MSHLGLACSIATLLTVGSGCQLIMDDIGRPDGDAGDEPPTDAGADAAADADADAAISVTMDAQNSDSAADASAIEAAQEAGADPDAAPSDTSVPDADPRACDGAGSRVFFADEDEDGYGNPSSFEVACSARDGYVSNGEDCNDENSAVNPGQRDFFPQGYLIPGTNLVSFDYDCDDEEVEGPDQPVASPQGCQGILPCTGAGYLKTERRDVLHANEYCGSRTILSCAALLVCAGGQESMTDAPYVCH